MLQDPIPKPRGLLMVIVALGLASCAERPTTDDAGSQNLDAVPVQGAHVGQASGISDDLLATGKTTDSNGTSHPSERGEQISVEVAGPGLYEQLLHKHRGKVVLVDFWATWCIPCMEKFPHTVEMNKKYRKDGLAILSMSLDDPSEKDQVVAFLQEQNAAFDNLISKLDAQSSMDAYEIDGGAIPHYKLYDREGNLRHTFATDPLAEEQYTSDDIEQKVKALLAEK